MAIVIQCDENAKYLLLLCYWKWDVMYTTEMLLQLVHLVILPVTSRVGATKASHTKDFFGNMRFNVF